MITGVHSEMPIPTRKAPAPPGNTFNQRNITWQNNDPFGSLTMTQPVQKKKPPPRPPPPKIRKDNLINHSDKSKKPTRPTELLTNLLGLKTSKHLQTNTNTNINTSNNIFKIPNNGSSSNQHSSNLSNGTGFLIDLSPPGSPTLTTRSSSDGVSIGSFGSDGNSNPSMFIGSGSTSQTDSAFEDDFDFFGSITKSNTPQNASQNNDPWKCNVARDPFSPLQNTNSIMQNINVINNTKIGNASFFAYNDASSSSSSTTFNSQTTSNISSMPTIIRARPQKPPVPKSIPTNLAPVVHHFNPPVKQQNLQQDNFSLLFNGETSWSKTVNNIPLSSNSLSSSPKLSNSSPPMPTIPPPAPPPEYLTDGDVFSTEKNDKPHGIALYDFEAIQSGDLTLKQGDIVILRRKINDEWLEGQIDNNIGIFPANFINIIVPLDNSDNMVTALYSFVGETWDDLPFEEGAKIKVLHKISDDWLYGQYQDKKGQFPASYVDVIPQNLPKYP